MTFVDKLSQVVEKNKSLVCVGLDPDINALPDHLKGSEECLFAFNKAIINATADLVCTYKPNSAFYEAEGATGIKQLKKTCDYIRTNYPDITILLDFKRGDIGNTNAKYAQFAFGYLQVDAITLQPYQGGEALEPFFGYSDKGLFILVKTSNPGSSEFQNLSINSVPLYEYVTQKALADWNKYQNIMVVAGATYPNELKRIRELVGPSAPILVPGMGAQGGELESMLDAGLNSQRGGLIINSSRAIIFASSGPDFAEAARAKTIELRDAINKAREDK